MMENTLENKAKFFAQYLGQKVLWCFNAQKENDLAAVKTLKATDLIRVYLGFELMEHPEIKPMLLLKNLWDLTEEDAKEIFYSKYELGNDFQRFEKRQYGIMIFYVTKYGRENSDYFVCFKQNMLTAEFPSFVADYFRSKGYAVEFNGLSVDKLVEYGWVKLL